MTYFRDLGPIDYFPFENVSRLRAVGWLEPGQDYTTGFVMKADFERLCQLLVDPFQPCTVGGFHSCEFCRFTDGPGVVRCRDVEVRVGCSNLFLPDGNVIYVAPSLVLHYIDAHEYQLPEPFWEAVRRCPDTRTMEFKKLLLASGGRGLRMKT